MCGIVGVVARPSARRPPSADEVLAGLDTAAAALGDAGSASAAQLAEAAERLAAVDTVLGGVPGVIALVRTPDLTDAIATRLAALDDAVSAVEGRLERAEAELDPAEVEAYSAAMIRLRDALWALGRDRLRTAAAVADLAPDGADAGDAALAAYTSVQLTLSALDRLEVRGRDSAGIQLLVRDHALDLDAAPWRDELSRRRADPLFTSGAVRTPGGLLALTYKAAAEIGELGDNTRAMRAALRADPLLHAALAAPGVRVTVLAHTRWASVGIISEANAHPVNSDELEGSGPTTGPYVAAALNGDVDNHAELSASNALRVHAEITTDAKVIPTLVARAAANGVDTVEAFRRTVSTFDGSVAIAAVSADAPDRLLLALRGSGQGLYVGIAEDAYIVASEPYGLVEVTPAYLRLDGEAVAGSSRGQVAVLDGTAAGTLEGIARAAYDGTPLPVTEADLTRAEITTRDIDRGEAPHFLLKEITEAPASFRKTLRGRLREVGGRLEVVLGERSLPADIAGALEGGRIRRIVVIGQGTAAVAGRSCAQVLEDLLAGGDGAGASEIDVDATTATELSGFRLRADMSDTLVVAVSQSGTTTDTNRTVDLVRERGARVIAIVNRRNSDLADKADGVLFTSDGRDVEMSVASTKAFYAQVAAGVLLACALARHLSGDDPGGAAQRQALLAALRELPDALAEVAADRAPMADAAHRLATSRRHWAVVGNGANVIAAEEIRIKLSELCYKSIACDVTEDKKHIDLSSEPLILVCAAGLTGSTADDVAKEVAIYRAHKAAPIVIATDGEDRFSGALAVLRVPDTDRRLAFVLAAMAGHLFGYEAALAIDALARPLREARGVVEDAITGSPPGEVVLARLRIGLAPIVARLFDEVRAGSYDGCLEASTALRVTTALRFASGALPLELYDLFGGEQARPDLVVDDVTAALTKAIEELTRPIDAIKHQAKTVTVGISRSDEGLLGNRLVREVLAAGAERDRLTYRTLKTIADLEPAIVAVHGATRYRITGDPDDGRARIEVVDKSGVAASLTSRVEANPILQGTKRRVATDRQPLVARGGADGRMVLLVPEVKGTQATGVTLLHVDLADRLSAPVARAVLQGYRDRYDVLADWVTESEASFDDERLATVAVEDLLITPVVDLADRWRG